MDFISLLYIKTNGHTEEKICVGLFGVNDEKRFFLYSSSKIRMAGSLLNDMVLRNVESSLKKLKAETEIAAKMPEFADISNFSRRTFEYLNTYSKGIFLFDEPRPIALHLNDDSFLDLFKLMVDDASKEKVNLTFNASVKKQLKREGFNKINKHYPIDANIIGTYVDHKVDFIGKNGSLLAGSAVDFNLKPQIVDKNLLEFRKIASSLKEFSRVNGLPEGNYNVYFSYPEQKESRILLDKVLKDKNKPFELSEVDQLSEVAKQLEDGNYMKFSEYLTEISYR